MPTTKQKFDAFDAVHPDLYPVFKGFAQELKDAGVERIRADEVLHRMRWEMATTDLETVSMSVLFGNRYAMKLIDEDDSWLGFFDLTVAYGDVDE